MSPSIIQHQPKTLTGMSKKNVTRNKIQNHSLTLFVKYGYNGVTMDQIAEQVGIAKSTIYYSYFRGKLELVKSILVDQMNSLKGIMKELSEVEGLEPTDIGRNMINAWFISLKENISWWRLLFRSMAEPQVADVIKAEYEKFYRQIREITTLLFTQSGTADPEKRSILLLATIDGLMYQSLFFNRIRDFDDIKDYLVQYFKI